MKIIILAHKFKKKGNTLGLDGARGKKQMSLLYRLGLFLKDRRFYSKPRLAMGVLILKLLESFSVGLGLIKK